MLNRDFIPQIRWVDLLGQCSECGKPAHGWLMNFRNEKVARVCSRCASKFLKMAEKRKAP